VVVRVESPGLQHPACMRRPRRDNGQPVRKDLATARFRWASRVAVYCKGVQLVMMTMTELQAALGVVERPQTLPRGAVAVQFPTCSPDASCDLVTCPQVTYGCDAHITVDRAEL
jgi:hypothetical protein